MRVNVFTISVDSFALLTRIDADEYICLIPQTPSGNVLVYKNGASDFQHDIHIYSKYCHGLPSSQYSRLIGQTNKHSVYRFLRDVLTGIGT